MALSTDVVSRAVSRLEAAADFRQPCPPVRDLLGRTDVGLAYTVQRTINQHRVDCGARVIGRKIGLTSPAVQSQMGVDRPDFGVLFDDMRYADDADVPMDRLIQPKAEAEIAFMLGEDLDSDDLDATRVRRAVEFAVAAIEIVDSRIEAWDITITDTVADNASSGLFVLGSDRVSLRDFEPIEAVMSMTLDGHVVSQGTGRACLGDPLLALAWLARTARELGDPLRAGQVVLSGALGPMVAVAAGSRVRTEIPGLGAVTVAFVESSSALHKGQRSDELTTADNEQRADRSAIVDKGHHGGRTPSVDKGHEIGSAPGVGNGYDEGRGVGGAQDSGASPDTDGTRLDGGARFTNGAQR
jgi:2-keto-4-pentenoate hydratase